MSGRFGRLLGLIVVLAVAAVILVPHERADAYYTTRLSDRETLMVLTPWETQFLLYNLQVGQKQPWCSAPGGGAVSSVIKVLNRICGGYRLRNKALYWRVRWLLYNATLHDACGAFVIHDGWVGTSLRAPRVWNHISRKWVTHAWTRRGETDYFKKENGYQGVRCAEYQNPQQQSPINFSS